MTKGPSLRARLFKAQLRLTRAKGTYADLDALHESIEQRTPAEEIQPPAALWRRLDVTRTVVRDRPCFTLAPKAPTSSKHVLYFHGGAYVHEIQRDHWRFFSRLIDRTGCTVTVPVYPLAPQYQAAETVAMIKDAYDHFLAGRDSGDQIIMGDSAGGALALVLSEALEEAGRPQPDELVLICPWLDITVSDPTQPDIDRRDPYLAIAGLREAGRLYRNDDLDPKDPLVSPLYGPLSNLGRVSVFVGTDDVLLADARRLRQRARDEGVELEYYEYPGMFHAWLLADLPEGRDAAERIAHIVSRVRHNGRTASSAWSARSDGVPSA
ncbi:alpha/beta hydrolase fold domain-containing protein [Prauserella muralis]|uniref:Esterase n=1 Tax=Prauserella muralis TaxID=588067 RepID=A0A2V4B7X0_9PSEU|nr:alpha/beta hydrolase [Prauserella muralis]PXY31337.1 esterase [Prauserella muralis]TWE14341.1 acetyl esterase/lipase [Prauserella muralis]